MCSSALTQVFGGGPWTMYSSRDNDVYIDGKQLVKVAKHFDYPNILPR